MAFEEPKERQSVMWGSGPYEELHRSWVELYESHRVDGGVSQPRPYLVTIGRRR